MPHQCKQTTCRRAPPGPRADNPVHWSAIMARKWIGIRASGGLAIAGSLATLVLGGLMLVSMTLAPPPTGPAAPPFPMAAIGIAMASIFALFSGWGIWTAIAVFRRCGWGAGHPRRAVARSAKCYAKHDERHTLGHGRFLRPAGGDRCVVAGAVQSAIHQGIFRPGGDRCAACPAVERLGDWLVFVDQLPVSGGAGGDPAPRLRIWRRGDGLGRSSGLHGLRRRAGLPRRRSAAPAGTGQGGRHRVLLLDGLEQRGHLGAARI